MTVPRDHFLVTGASGFIGLHLVRELVRVYGYSRVTALVHPKAPAREAAGLKELAALQIELIPFDLLQPNCQLPPPSGLKAVYHLAGCGDTENANSPFLVNSSGTRHLIHWLGPQLAGSRFIHAGTLASIDQPGSESISESTPCHPKTEYGRTKLQGEKEVQQLQNQWGYEFTILRLCTILGPGYRPAGMWGLFPAMLRRHSWITRLNWPGRCAFMVLEDLVRLLVQLPELPESTGQLYLVGNGENPSFDEVLEKLAAVLGITRRRIRLPRCLWLGMGNVAWRWAGSSLLPYSARIALWRAAQMTHHRMKVDNRKLDRLAATSWTPIEEGLRTTFGCRNP